MSPNIELAGAPSAQSERSGPLTTPPELAGPLPRAARITSVGITTAVYAAVLVVLAAAGVVWLSMRAVHGLEHRAALRHGGVVASGEITRLHYAGRSSTLIVNYTFSFGGTYYKGDAPAPRRLKHAFQEHDFVDIRYLPNNPAVNHPAAWEESTLSFFMPFIVPFVPALIAYLLLMVLPFEKHLAVEGVFATAEVTEIFRAKTGFGVKYEFRTQDGAMAKGSSVDGSRREIGSKVGVVYLRRNPAHNRAYPLQYYRVAE